jgi:hypothetical protein
MTDVEPKPLGFGKGPNLEAAVWQAWENAKAERELEERPKYYRVELFIEASNPIHAYVATIFPADG